MTSAATAAPVYDLPTLERRTDFIAEALDFTARPRGDAAFPFLRFFLRASDEELGRVMGKIWCDAHTAAYGTADGKERLRVSLLKSLAQPFTWLVRKKLLWTREAAVDYDFETVDASYFGRWYLPVYGRLPGLKRITPSSSPLPRSDAADPVLSSVTPRTIALMLAAPLFLPALAALSRRYGRNLAAPFRVALGLYACFEGHFRRYPTRHYLAYNDDHNHPCRHLAFKQNCAGRMAVVQNGERTHHPSYAFGSMDDYLVFGPVMERLCRDLKVRVDRVIPVGALYLNSWKDSASSESEPDIDVLFVDQLVWPYNGFDEETGRAFESSFSALNELKRRRPDLRVAFQLRNYAEAALHENELVR